MSSARRLLKHLAGFVLGASVLTAFLFSFHRIGRVIVLALYPLVAEVWGASDDLMAVLFGFGAVGVSTLFLVGSWFLGLTIIDGLKEADDE